MGFRVQGIHLYGGFPKIRGSLLGNPYNKDYSILGSILRYPYFGKLPYVQCTLKRSQNSPERPGGPYF